MSEEQFNAIIERLDRIEAALNKEKSECYAPGCLKAGTVKNGSGVPYCEHHHLRLQQLSNWSNDLMGRDDFNSDAYKRKEKACSEIEQELGA